MIYVLYETNKFPIENDEDSWGEETVWEHTVTLILASGSTSFLEKSKTVLTELQEKLWKTRQAYRDFMSESFPSSLSFMIKDSNVLEWFDRREKILGEFERASNKKLDELVQESGYTAVEILAHNRKEFHIDLVESL